MTKILVVDDDSSINELIKINLELQGYEVVQAFNGIEGFAKAKQEEPSLVVLDVMMPEVDGYTVAQRIRQCDEIADTPIIMLTALSELNDKVSGFNIGVDDYLTKPFETKELLARIRALLRRKGNVSMNENVKFMDIDLDRTTHEIQKDGQHIKLTKKEYDILEILMTNRGKVIPKESFVTKIWGYDSDVEYNSIEVYISFLRKKLGAVGSSIKISTVRSMGYTITQDELIDT